MITPPATVQKKKKALKKTPTEISGKKKIKSGKVGSSIDSKQKKSSVNLIPGGGWGGGGATFGKDKQQHVVRTKGKLQCQPA